MTVPPTMSFVDMTTTGDPDVLRLGIGPVPTPKAGEVLVRVHAAGVNRPDIQQRRDSIHRHQVRAPSLDWKSQGRWWLSAMVCVGQ